MILVSGCLVGQSCRYDGRSKTNQRVIQHLESRPYMTFCPEVMGGLSVPREPAEKQLESESVVDKAGFDVTAAFMSGAEQTVALAERTGCTLVISKEGSPSCGVHRIYDGSFSGQSIPGCGLTTERLKDAGYRVISEEEV